MKPLDEELILSLAAANDILITIEEGSKGGFGDAVLHLLSEKGVFDKGKLRARTMVIPEMWIEAGPQHDQVGGCRLTSTAQVQIFNVCLYWLRIQYDIAGLNAPHIVAKVEGLLHGLRAHT